MTEHDLTRLVDSADCSTPNCPNEADGRDGLCRMCRTVPSRRTLLAPTPGSLAHLMDDEPPARPTRRERLAELADDVDGILDDVLGPTQETPMPTCKIDGCVEPSAGKGGWCVGLCNTHISEEGTRRQRVRRERERAAAKPPASVKAPSTAPRPGAAPARTPDPGPAGKAEAGPALVELAQAVDQARATLRDLQAKLDDAKADLAIAVDELRQAVQELAA